MREGYLINKIESLVEKIKFEVPTYLMNFVLYNKIVKKYIL